MSVQNLTTVAIAQESSESEYEEINKEDALSQLPEENLLRIFGWLSSTALAACDGIWRWGAIELAKCGEVSRRWSRLTSDDSLWNSLDINNFHPSLTVFGGSDWGRYVDLAHFKLKVDDEIPFDKRRVIAMLKSNSSLPIEGKVGCMVLTIPEGLTLEILIKLTHSPKIGYIGQYQYIDPRVVNGFGNVSVRKAYQIAIANNVFEGSRELSDRAREDFVNEMRKKGWEEPGVLEQTALLVVAFMAFGKHLYYGTYTICSERLPLMIGQGVGRQVTVGAPRWGFFIADVYFNRKEALGIGGVRRNL